MITMSLNYQYQMWERMFDDGYHNVRDWRSNKDKDTTPIARVRFTVSGNGHFPLDMLRYDRVGPAQPEDYSWMNVDEKTGELGDFTQNIREAMLVKYFYKMTEARLWLPTLGRWQSFSWRVSALYKVEKFLDGAYQNLGYRKDCEPINHDVPF